MSNKREYDHVDDSEIPEPHAKRPKKQSARSRQHQNSSIDPTWGQKYVFSGGADATTIPVGEESEFEDDADAMAYLHSVRQQAKGIPHLLVAPKVQIGPQLPAGFNADLESGEEDEGAGRDELDRSIYTDGVGDSRGFYDDGAYVAMPEDWNDDRGEDGEIQDDEGEASEAAILEAYFTSLMDQYLHLRNRLNKKPPPEAVARLLSSQPTHADPFGRYSKTTKIWSQQLRDNEPNPTQVALMSKDTILRILRVMLGGKFLRRGYPLPERTSRWLWALLARLPDGGGLNHAEIGWIRDLGRRAVLLGRSLAEMAALRDELAESGLGVNEGVDGSSSDEDVVAGEDAQEIIEGAHSPNDQDDSHATTPATAPAREDNANADTNTTRENEANEKEANEKEEEEEGEIDEGELSENESEGVAMDLSSDDSADEGEIDEGNSHSNDNNSDLEAAKRALLSRLEGAPAISEEERQEEDAKRQSRMNLRATLNMILTVAGDFYGQRDLLEFRDPFVGL